MGTVINTHAQKAVKHLALGVCFDDIFDKLEIFLKRLILMCTALRVCVNFLPLFRFLINVIGFNLQ